MDHGELKKVRGTMRISANLKVTLIHAVVAFGGFLFLAFAAVSSYWVTNDLSEQFRRRGAFLADNLTAEVARDARLFRRFRATSPPAAAHPPGDDRRRSLRPGGAGWKHPLRIGPTRRPHPQLDLRPLPAAGRHAVATRKHPVPRLCKKAPGFERPELREARPQPRKHPPPVGADRPR